MAWPIDSRMGQCQEYEIEVLSERLELLQITDNVSENTIEYIYNMLIVLAIVQQK